MQQNLKLHTSNHGNQDTQFRHDGNEEGLSRSVLSTEDCEGGRVISNDSPIVDLRPLVELLQQSHMVSVGHQFELLVKIIRQLTIPRALVDPLKAFWELIKQKAKSIPVVPLAAAAVSKHKRALCRSPPVKYFPYQDFPQFHSPNNRQIGSY